MRLAKQNPASIRIEQYKHRYPACHDVTARKALRSIVPSVAKESMLYRDTQEAAAENVANFSLDMEIKSYPHAWWRPLLCDRFSA